MYYIQEILKSDGTLTSSRNYCNKKVETLTESDEKSESKEDEKIELNVEQNCDKKCIYLRNQSEVKSGFGTKNWWKNIINGKSKIKEIYSVDVSKAIQDNIVKEANDNVKDLNQFNSKIDGFNNAEYLKQRKGTVDQNMRVAELDFILNSILTNMNYMQLMTGDPALYYKSKGNVQSKDIKEYHYDKESRDIERLSIDFTFLERSILNYFFPFKELNLI